MSFTMARSLLVCDQRADRLAADHALDVAARVQVEDDDGQLVVAAQRDRGRVHDLEVLLQHLEVGDAVEAPRVGVLDRILVVDAVDLGGLEQHLGVDLHRAQRRRGVGREVGIAGAGGEDDDPPLLEVADRAPADVRLGELLHLDRRLDARGHADAARARPAAPARSSRWPACPCSRRWRGPCPCAEPATPRKMLPPPMTIATSTPSARTSAISEAMRSSVDGVDAEAGVAHEGLAGELEQDALEAGCGLSHGDGRVGDRRRGV